jgi:hypothetical protein
MAKLLLHFTGLCGFVPDKTKKEMTVLLPDATVAGHHSEPHEPILFCESKFLKGGRPADVTFSDKTGNKWAVFYLADQEVIIKDADRDKLDIRKNGGAGKGCPTTANKFDFDWVAEMAEADPKTSKGIVHPDCLNKAKNKAELIGRIYLTEGILRVGTYAKQSSGLLDWDFIDETNTTTAKKRVLADSVILEDSRGILKTTVLPKRVPKHNVVTELYRTATDYEIIFDSVNAVSATIANIPWSQIFKVRDPAKIRPTDHHFSHFYDLCSAKASKPVPHPNQSSCNGAGLPSSGNPLCPPVRFAPI